MTLDKAHIHLDQTFYAPGQAYVALSRVKKLEDLHLLSFSKNAILTSDTVKELMDTAVK